MEKQNSATSIGDDSKPPSHKVKLMCSYGGKIQPRPHDHHLTYAGGDTKILAVDRRVTYSDILTKLNSLSGAAPDDDVVSFKYQLPGEDLDALVSVIDDDDLEHMMAEYDRICECVSPKPARLRIFLFSASRTGLDRMKTASTSPPLNPDFLFGFDKDYEYDYQTRSVQEADLPRGSGAVRPDLFTGSDPRNTAEMKIQPQIQGIPFAPHGLHETFSRENSHVAGGGQVVYGIPQGYQGGAPGPYGVTAVRMMPVYSYFPAMHAAPAAMNGVGVEDRGHVAGDEGGRPEVYNGVVGVVSPHQIADGKTNM
ncbi:uncharacterized protein LOC131298529 [Rhododendron vialii]|uniref:uncharacterized protein LOC131298529 n=1 Tax=Rhododendron vialii TaxID=182163 RepID=UPI00265E22D0|nr:uncharacterized protein LOC131298529 [Rhododendron vialii]